MSLLWFSALIAVLMVDGSSGQGRGGMGQLHNQVKVCTMDMSTGEWVRRGIHMRKRGNCVQGYLCSGKEAIPLDGTCDDGTYFSVHTGVCSRPNMYAYLYGSFDCSAEEADENLDHDTMIAKRDEACAPLMAQANLKTKVLYAGDRNDCRMTFKCPNVAEHDDWLHRCPVGFMFVEGDEGPCGPSDGSCP